MSEKQNEELKAAEAVEVPMMATMRGLLPLPEISRRSLALRSILEILIGVLLLWRPFASLVVLAIVIGAFLAVDAIGLFLVAVRQKDKARSLGIVYAVLVLVLGILTMAFPLLVSFFWIILLGAWQLIIGVNWLTVEVRGVKTGRLRLAGILSILVGICFIIWPLAGLGALLLVTGILLLLNGVFSLIAGFILPGKK